MSIPATCGRRTGNELGVGAPPPVVLLAFFLMDSLLRGDGSGPRWHSKRTLTWESTCGDNPQASSMNDGLLGPKLALGQELQCLDGVWLRANASGNVHTRS